MAVCVHDGASRQQGSCLGFGSCPMTALYAASHVCLPPGFAACDTGTTTVVMTWLVPITGTEAPYVHARGWPAFEDALLTEILTWQTFHAARWPPPGIRTDS